MLQSLDQSDAKLWQKVLNAITMIYADEEAVLKHRREVQKAKLRQVVDELHLSDVTDWKQAKEDALVEVYG
jgi:hypothetical protein